MTGPRTPRVRVAGQPGSPPKTETNGPSLPPFDPSLPPRDPADETEQTDEAETFDIEALVAERVAAALETVLAEQESAIKQRVEDALADMQQRFDAASRTQSTVEQAVSQQAAVLANPVVNPLTPLAGSIVTNVPEVRRRTSAPNRQTGTITEHFIGGDTSASEFFETRPRIIDEGDEGEDVDA